MNCCECNIEAQFFCDCTHVYLCHLHIKQHLLQGHKCETLIILNSNETSELNRTLEKKIKSLTTLKHNLQKEIKQIIKQLQEKLSSEIRKIDEKLNNYTYLMKIKSYHQNFSKEFKDITNTNIVLKPIDSTELQNSITNFFDQELIITESDPIKDLICKQELFYEHYVGSFKCIKISYNRNFIVTGSEDCSVRIWDLVSRAKSACLVKHRSTVLCVDISKNSKFAASGSYDKSVILWDTDKKECKAVYKGHSGAVYSVAFNFDSTVFVSGSYGREIMVWGTFSTYILRRIDCVEMVRSCILTRENKILAGIGTKIYQWSLIDYSFEFEINAHASYIKSITTANNENYIITGSYDKRIKIWDSRARCLIGTLTGHNQDICSVVVTSNDEHLISCSKDNMILIWNLITFEQIYQFQVNVELLTSLDVIGDNIIFVSRDSKIGIASIERKLVSYFGDIKQFNIGTDIHQTNKVIFASENKLLLADTDSITNPRILESHQGEIQYICISKSESFIISCSSSERKNLILWKLDDLSTIFELKGHTCSVFCVDISDDESLAASGDRNGKILITDLKYSSRPIVLNEHTGSVHSIKFMHSGEFAASGGFDKNFYIWDIKNKCVRSKLPGHLESIWKIVVTDDDKYFFSADLFHGIIAWNIKDDKLKQKFSGLDEAKNWIDVYREVEFKLIRYLF